MFRRALGTPTRLGRSRALRKREPAVATPGGLDHQLLALRLHRVTDMREVGFDLPLRYPQGTRELTGLPRTHPEQGDDLLSRCRCPMFHRVFSLHPHHPRSALHSSWFPLIHSCAPRAMRRAAIAVEGEMTVCHRCCSRARGSPTSLAMEAQERERSHGGASTIRVKFQVSARKGPKLVALHCFLHVGFRSRFGTVFQGVRRVFTLSRAC